MQQVTPEDAVKLRKPFDKNEINQIPRKNNKTGATVKLDYVGHAAVTDRLIEVDPSWSWEPMGRMPSGAPVIDVDEFNRPIGMWIYLTVCGVTRPGYGYVDQPAKHPDKPLTEANESTKQIISDAIRNAAMRFGVALDLWRKEDKHVSAEGYGERTRSEPRQTPPSSPQSTQPPEDEGQAVLTQLPEELATKALMIASRKKIREAHKQHPKVQDGSIQQMTWPELQAEWPEETR